MRACKTCGKEITARSLRSRFCSPRCWYISNRKRIQKTCVVCFKSFETVRSDNRRACSMECGWKLERRRTPLKCETCGVNFWRHNSTTRRFCSRRCANKAAYKQVQVRCGNCRKLFTRCRAAVARVKNTFCTRECSAEFSRGPQAATWRGGNHHYRGTDWPGKQAAARKRDGNVCQVCGKPKAVSEELSVDHIIPYRLVLCNELWNLLSVCRAPCHAEKTAIEVLFLRGDVLGFLQGLRERGWPMDKVENAISLFNAKPQIPLIGNLQTVRARRPLAPACGRGHLFSTDNVRFVRGSRVCLTCERARRRLDYHRHRDELRKKYRERYRTAHPSKQTRFAEIRKGEA